MCPFVGLFGILNPQVWSTGLPCSVNYRLIICQLPIFIRLIIQDLIQIYTVMQSFLCNFFTAPALRYFLASKTVLWHFSRSWVVFFLLRGCLSAYFGSRCVAFNSVLFFIWRCWRNPKKRLFVAKTRTCIFQVTPLSLVWAKSKSVQNTQTLCVL